MSLQKQESYSLTEQDIRDCLGADIKITLIPDLVYVKYLDQLFDKHGRAVFLFETSHKPGSIYGHWICLFKTSDNSVEYFDSYGNPPDYSRTWLTPRELDQTNQEMPFLSNLLKRCPYKVVINSHRFQSFRRGVNTCGRHVVCRLLHSHQSLPQYTRMIGKNADKYVCSFTSNILGY